MLFSQALKSLFALLSSICGHNANNCCCRANNPSDASIVTPITPNTVPSLCRHSCLLSYCTQSLGIAAAICFEWKALLWLLVGRVGGKRNGLEEGTLLEIK